VIEEEDCRDGTQGSSTNQHCLWAHEWDTGQRAEGSAEK
jgi:hypothetical protein